jgi:hypothetical protein
MSNLSVAGSSGSEPQINQTQMAQMKSQFDQLGKALASSDLAAAKKAFSALQQNVPKGAPQGDQGRMAQVKSQFDQLGQALDSGDLTAAKKAYSAIQQSAPKGAPPAGGGAPPASGGSKGAAGGSSTGSSTSTDPKDLNGDGTVTEAERLIYGLSHPDLTKKETKAADAPEAGKEKAFSADQRRVDLTV